MRSALHAAARGVAPPGSESTAATSMLPARDEPTAATRMAGSPPPSPPSRGGARRLEPQAPPGGLPPARYEPIPDIPPSRRDMEPSRKSGGGLGKLIAVLAIAAVLAVAIAFAIGSSQGGSSVNLSPIDGNDTGEVVDQLNSLIDDNTR